MNELKDEVARTVSLTDQVVIILGNVVDPAILVQIVSDLKAANDKLAAALLALTTPPTP